ncbi:DUF6701 domain-containing protein [Vibrio rumoiensis]|uniref:DUF6701 domain-containing protein n=1 Tax=Vibrio rumoiensis TaxID=76258 RepID=UPI0037497BD4
MRYLTKLMVLFFVLMPISVWAANKCSNVKASSDFSVTVTIDDYDPTQTYELTIDPRGSSGSEVKVWSNQYDPTDPALINPTNSDLSFISGERYQIRFNYAAETNNSGTLTYYLKKGNSSQWTEVSSAYLTIANNSNNDVTISGNAEVACSEYIPETPVEPDIDWCEYFPEPAQSWITQGTSDYSGYPQSTLNMTNVTSGNSYIKGWSTSYIQNNQIEIYDGAYNGNINVLRTGFDNTGDSYQIHNSKACDISGCEVGGADVDSRKAKTPEPLNVTFPAGVNLTIRDGNYIQQCSSTSSLCSYSESGNTATIYIIADLSSLSVYNYSSKNMVIEFFGDRKIGEYVVENNVTTNFPDSSTQTFNTARFNNGNMAMNFGHNSRINVVTSWDFSNPVAINGTVDSDTLLYGPEATFTFNTPNVPFYGLIVAKSVSFETAITIYGRITANTLTMKDGVKIIGDNTCQSPPTPDPNYTLDVTPDNQFALLCQAPEVTFTVYSDDGSVATDYDGTITATFPEGLTPSAPTVGTKNSDYIYTPNQGEVVVPVKSATLQEYTVNAELTDDSDAKDSGNLLFGPYKFFADTVKAVAGHPTQFDVQVLACKNDQVTPVQGYSGDKDLTITNISLTKPTLNQGAVDGDLEVSAAQNGSYSASDVTLNFTDEAKSSAYLNYEESGSLNFTLTDPDFVCPTDYDGCEVTNDDDSTENITTLQGLINVDVRPWTFAVCSPTNQDMSGDSDGGIGFIAAGEKFNLEVKPIVWQSGGSLTGDIDVSHYCNANVTKNFLLTQAQTATVVMGSELATPIDGRLGSGIQPTDGGSLEREHDAVLNSGDDHYTFNDVTWQEVGSLAVNADSNADYLGMDINRGYREIGRFYPHHFKLENDNNWDYASGHNGFAYMNQPIAMDYRVKAKSATDSDTQNYGYFANSLKAGFVIEAIEKEIVFGTEVDGESLNNRLSSGDNQSLDVWDKATYTFNSNDFMFLKFSVNTAPYLTTPDGPYRRDNSVFGVGVDVNSSTYENQDEVNFEQDFVDTDTFTAENSLDGMGVSFFHQPTFRYGRMTLDAVSGPIGGPISVPLRVEYWDGASFVVNNDDNGSLFKTDVYYVMSNTSGSSAQLTSSSASSSFISVANGKSSRVQAKQSTATRETVRLFLRQGNISGGFGNNSEPAADDELNATIDGWKNSENIEQPWLQFNWRDKGDEDPSTVVSFGAYRGNDRIIYRGEPNLTAN